jgi:hypothetical protein
VRDDLLCGRRRVGGARQPVEAAREDDQAGAPPPHRFRDQGAAVERARATSLPTSPTLAADGQDEDEDDNVEALLQQSRRPMAATPPRRPRRRLRKRRPTPPAMSAVNGSGAAALVIPVGVLNLRSQRLRVSLFDSLADPTWLSFTMESAQLVLDQHSESARHRGHSPRAVADSGRVAPLEDVGGQSRRRRCCRWCGKDWRQGGR